MSARRTRLRRTKKNSAPKIAIGVFAVLSVAILIVTIVGAAAAYGLVQKWLQDLPDYKAKNAFDVAQATTIYSADGKLLARLYLENRQVVPISQVSPYLVKGIVAVEDERFYEHHGVDPIGLARAALRTFTGHREGASTITQQYIRNTLLLDERLDMTLARKFREAYLALELEKRYTKTEILEMYLNTIYLGEGAYGVQAASLEYFDRPANKLTLPQAALIAGLAQRPTDLDPYNNPEGAITRRNEVLARLLANNYITQAEYASAVATKLKLQRNTEPNDGIYQSPYFVAHVKKLLQQQFSPSVVFKGGLTVYTTIDTRLQKYADQAVHGYLHKKHDPEGALVSIDPRNGYVRALVGGENYKKNKFNLATQAYRQPGSAFKTFVLVTALDKGMPPYMRVDSSSPAVIPSKPKPWMVDNSEGAGRGMMSLQSATAASVNTVFARVAWAVGIKNVAETAKRMGITSDIPNYPSIALGAANVSPYDMAAAYATLASEGIRHDPVCITKVVDRDDKTIFVAKDHGTRVIKATVAKAAIDIMKGVITGGTATRARIGRPAAGKTGTSQLNRDVWFVGFTPQLVTAVWVGYPKERTIYVNGSRAFGGTVCAPIWATFMRKALAGLPALDFRGQPRPPYNPSKFHIPISRPPKVTGLSVAAASRRLGGYGFTIEYVWSNKPVGTVVGQSFAHGKIVLRVSKGKRPVVAPPTPPPSGETSGTGGHSGGGGGGTGGGGSGETSGTP